MTSFQDAPDEAIKADEAKEACSTSKLAYLVAQVQSSNVELIGDWESL